MHYLYLVSILGVAAWAAHPEDKKPASKPSASIRGAVGVAQKLERIENSLGKLAKSPIAPDGIQKLLKDVHQADDRVQKAPSEDVKKAVFQNISVEIAAFQEQLIQKKTQLLEADKADRANRTKSLSSVVSKLQAREAHIEAMEKKEKEAHKHRQESLKETVATMKKNALTDEEKHTDKLIKYLTKKQERKFHKKVAQWKEEKQALHEAIDAAKVGNADKVISGIKQLTNIEKGDQNFLH
jgi:CCR4-NOT transcriptional regulation complex NOT5 subunit